MLSLWVKLNNRLWNTGITTHMAYIVKGIARKHQGTNDCFFNLIFFSLIVILQNDREEFSLSILMFKKSLTLRRFSHGQLQVKPRFRPALQDSAVRQ
jgi:hypothetical protein